MFLQYGKQFSLIYYIIFSPYQQLGGLLFGIAFWFTARKIRRKNLNALVNITGIGISLLFGSVVIHGLSYVVFPPFGLVTVSFMALASYMLFIGIWRSSKELTRDATIRREIYKIAGQEYSLLRNIGLAELNRTIKARVDPILEKIAIQEESQVQEKMDESDYKKFIAEALQEIEDRKRLRDTS
jgi:high-affinity Fe2+/Pb2+ permease